jgi:O-antigen/teichoic acid export membrane protein
VDLLKNKVFLGNILSKTLAFIIFYIYAISMGVVEYGAVVLILAVVNTIVEMASSGLNASLLRYVAKNQDNPLVQNSVLYTSLINSLIFFIVLLLVALVFIENISITLFGSSEYILESILVIFSCIFSFVFSMLINYFLGKEALREYFVLVVSLPVVRIIQIIFLLLISDVNIESVVYISFISVFLVTIVCLFIVLDSKDLRYSKDLSSEMFDYGSWMFLWSVFTVFQSKFELFYLAAVLGATALANYDVALKMIVLVMVLYTSYTALMKPKFAKCNHPQEVHRVIRECFPYISFISLLFLVAGIILPIILPIVGFDDYVDSSVLFRIMSFSLCIFVFSSLFNSVVFSSGKSKFFFYISIVELIFKVLSLYFLVNIYGVYGAAYSYAFVNILSLFLSYYFYKQSMQEWRST